MLSNLHNFDKLIINPAFAGQPGCLEHQPPCTVTNGPDLIDATKNYSFSAHAPFHNDRMGLGLFVDKEQHGHI